MKKTLSLWAVILCFTSLAKAGDPDDSTKLMQEQIRIMDSIESSLNYKTGKITLGNGIATINVPEGFKFLEPAEAKYVLGDLWGNPITQAPLGLLFPASSGATDPGGYAFVIQFEEIGYVKDKDADKINYDDLLKSLKEESAKENAERLRTGGYAMNLLGWAAKPFYDKERKILYWAKEFSVTGQDDNTLNYDIRVLGRKGVLNLQAISGMEELDSVKAHINDVLGMVAFTEGNRYSDFDSKTDKVAAWTIGGLVAGKILAKVGFWAVIVKFFKFIAAGVVLAVAALWRFISGRKKKQEEFVYEPQPAPDNNEQSTPPAAQ